MVRRLAAGSDVVGTHCVLWVLRGWKAAKAVVVSNLALQLHARKCSVVGATTARRMGHDND
jgi:hypothetical protein